MRAVADIVVYTGPTDASRRWFHTSTWLSTTQQLAMKSMRGTRRRVDAPSHYLIRVNTPRPKMASRSEMERARPFT